MLMGAQLFWQILNKGQISLGHNKPVLQQTHLGWIIGGALNISPEQNSLNHLVTNCHIGADILHKQVERFFQIDDFGNKRNLSSEEILCEEHFRQNYRRDLDGRFMTATKRFIALETKLQREPALRNSYSEFIHEYLALDHMERVPDPTDFSVLTPAHFLIGEPMTAPLEPNLEELKINRLSRWQRIEQLGQQFWRRWIREYIPQLQLRPKGQRITNDNVQPGDMVLIKEDNVAPLHWPLGRVVQIHPGHDGVVRVVSVKTAKARMASVQMRRVMSRNFFKTEKVKIMEEKKRNILHQIIIVLSVVASKSNNISKVVSDVDDDILEETESTNEEDHQSSSDDEEEEEEEEEYSQTSHSNTEFEAEDFDEDKNLEDPNKDLESETEDLQVKNTQDASEDFHLESVEYENEDLQNENVQYENDASAKETDDPYLEHNTFPEFLVHDRHGYHTASVFLKESFRPVVLLWSYICIYVRLVLTDSNTMASPILHLTPLDFNFWGHRKDLLTWRLQKVSIYHIPPIWKDRPKFEDAFKSNVQNKKKLRCSHYDDIDKSLLGWFKEKRSQGIPISGPILQAKAKDFGRLLGMENVECSKAGSNDFETVIILDEQIFNADETGLFFKMTPNKILKFKGEKCSGGKMSKDRITVLVVANMTGTVKKKLLVIGKSKNPRCFKNVKRLPVDYKSNRRAWMVSEIFEKFLRDWDKELSFEGHQFVFSSTKYNVRSTAP
ncbi:hypothetical protein GEV33_002264 [Tenebrio molitor]|uniref:HTH CENPB-type domain-containing protein n=1 Tax=Tenebrio molitor TaxID=7067 RepID=A0A8J6HUH7_TENMO|nr:hypothetical protein GEV33_002264 [Tenebrio molitor]